MLHNPSVAVIGAGMAGLTLAKRLQQAGCAVTLFDKSRGVGGRMATRRSDSGVTFDHGAQYFTVRDPLFAQQVAQWQQAGLIALWTGHVVALRSGTMTTPDEPVPRFIGVPTMNALTKHLATGLRIHTQTTLVAIEPTGSHWQLRDQTEAVHGPYDWIVVTAPPVQSAALLSPHSEFLAGKVGLATMAPCWCVMLQLESPLAVAYDGAFVHESPLSWIARNTSKPGRDPSEAWVLHASPTWSHDHLELSAEQVSERLLDAFWQATGVPRRPAHHQVAHRWRYALPVNPLPEQFLCDPEMRLAACGDWCGGPRVEGAFLSGWHLADALLA